MIDEDKTKQNELFEKWIAGLHSKYFVCANCVQNFIHTFWKIGFVDETINK